MKPAKPSPVCGKSRVFGPVPSRRLGFSLGVDVIPYKTCALDCVYCQLGSSHRPSVVRRRYVNARPVVEQIRAVLNRKGRIDYITFSGSGEPTLNSDLGKMIRGVKRITEVPVAVLTGASLLDRPEVRRELSSADLVVPSLDAGTERVFRRVNRPHPSLTLDKITEGIAAFSRGRRGKLWLEVMLVRGMNDSEGELRALARRIRRIAPDRVQLTTVARPPAEKEARPLTGAGMRRAVSLLRRFLPGIPVEAAGEFDGRRKEGGQREPSEAVLGYLRRRAATSGDLTRALGLVPADVRRALLALVRSRKVERGSYGGKIYYRIAF